MNKEQFISELAKINITLTEEQINQLEIYKEFLIEYNTHTNLTAIKEESGIYLKHFYDSITMNQYIKKDMKILDIGTGAGFPGMVLAILNKDSFFTLLDSNNKKTTFLKLLTKKLNLKNVEVIHARAEEYIHIHKEEFDIVTSRAVAELRILAEMSLPALKIGGKFIPLKANVQEEIPLFLEALQVLNGKLIKMIAFCLPIENSKRTILEVEHFDTTSEIYPRSYDKICKKPLKNENK